MMSACWLQGGANSRVKLGLSRFPGLKTVSPRLPLLALLACVRLGRLSVRSLDFRTFWALELATTRDQEAIRSWGAGMDGQGMR